MSWTKLSDDFADDLARIGLSDGAFRAHVEGLIYTMRRETGGYLDRIAVRRYIETLDADAAVAELVTLGLWRPAGDGWVIAHHMEHQPEPDVLAKRREQAADRKRRERRRRSGFDTEGDLDVTA